MRHVRVLKARQQHSDARQILLRYRRSTLFVLSMMPLFTACIVVSSDMARGSGRVVSEARDVRDFTAVALEGTGKLMIEQTGAESLTIEAEDNILPLLTSDVSGGTLRLGTRSNTFVAPTKPIVYRLTVKNLEDIGVSGSDDVIAPNLTASTLTIGISGSGDVTIGGTTDRQDITVSGSGTYSAEDLESKTANVQVSGSGDVILRVSEALDASVSGSGSIAYIGDPTVTQQISGSGEITKR